MAGYSTIYCVGGKAGAMTGDGINPILFQILVGEAGRKWLEVHYFNAHLRPLGNVHIIIPKKYDDPYLLLDACIAFFPQHFASCPSLAKVAEAVEKKSHLDFAKEGEPPGWRQLREEAMSSFRKLYICKAELQKV